MAEPLFTPEQLAEVLKRSRIKNRQLGVTGVLLARRGHFIQALEGEEAAVRKLAAIIQQDPRHGGFTVIYEGPSEVRQFPDWAMGFCELAQPGGTQGGSLIEHMLAGTVTARSPADGLRLIRAIFRAFALDSRSTAA